MLGKLKESLGFSYFQARFHAYVEMSWYFGIMCVAALISTIWSAGIMEPKSVKELHLPVQAEECGKINTFLYIFAIISLAEAASSFLVTVGLPSIMRSSNWAIFGLTSLGLMFLVYAAKLGGIVLGMVWVWAKTDVSCEVATPRLYSHASTFLICMITLYVFQLLFGTSFLMCCGIEDAVGEGVFLVSSKYNRKDLEENADLLAVEEAD